MRPINGWTKEGMIAHINKEFKGKSVGVIRRHEYMNDSCMYRGPNGTKCAVGMFIPDDKYSHDMETFSPEAEPVKAISNLFPLTLEEMRQMQYIHDVSEPENTLSDIIGWIESNVEGDTV
jgi:hypothetical protein